jgi:cyclase
VKRSFAFTLLAIMVFPTIGLMAQDKAVYVDKALTPVIHELTIRYSATFEVNLIASVGPDGILLVDSGYESGAPALVEALNTFGKGLPRIVINTHSHIEHLAGQAAFGGKPVIISQANLRDRYVNGLYVFNGLPPEALPQVTFSDSMSLFFNGEEIKLIAFPGAHDDSDIIVWFTKSKVVCTEALIGCGHFPTVDGETGDVLRYPEVAARIIATLPEDVVLVPGHSEACDMAGARAFQAMLAATIDIVRKEMAQGKTLHQMLAEDVLAPYKAFESYVGRNDWLQFLTDALSGPTPTPGRGQRPWPYGLLYRAYTEKGADGLIQAYDRLKAEPGDYFLVEKTLLLAGRRLSSMRKDYQGAIRVFEHWLKEYPNGRSLGLCYSSLGDAHEKLGDKAKALGFYRLALKSSPDDPSLQAKVKELEGSGPAPKEDDSGV